MSYLGVPPFGQTVRTTTELTATAAQTTFIPAGGYLPGYIDVFMNGVLLDSSDYTATNGSTVVLTAAAALNDEIKTIAYWPVSLIDTYRKAEVDAFAVKLTGDQTVAGVKTFSSDPVMGVSGLTGTLAKARFPAGSVLQVVSVDYATAFSSTSSVPVDVSGFAASITPTSATSKILVFVTVCFGFANDTYPYILLVRNGVSIGAGTTATGVQINTFLNATGTSAANTIYRTEVAAKSFLDSPATTSALTYKIQFANPYQVISNVAYLNRQGATDNATYTQRPTSSITLMEIAA